MSQLEGYPPGFSEAFERCKNLGARRLELERELADNEILLREAWKQVPHLKIRVFYPCAVCHQPTSEKFGERSMCHKHIGRGDGKGDETIIKILDTFLHGNA